MTRTPSRTSPSPHAQRLRAIAVMLLAVGGSALALWLVGLFLYTVIRPVFKQAVAASEVRTLAQQVAAKKVERDRLQAIIARAKTQEGQETIGRGMGYLKPGEHAIRVQITAPTAPAAATAPAVTNQRLFWFSLASAFILGFGVLFIRWRLRRRRAPAGTLRTRDAVVGRSQGFRPVG